MNSNPESKPQLEVSLSPALLPLCNVKESIVVIIDVLRATSTIATVFYNGASAVIPVATIKECLAAGEKYNALTAGERDGRVAPELSHGNSPFEYPEEFIKGQTLVLTTTNGTRLLQKVKNAKAVITGSFPNLTAVCTYLIQQSHPVILACAGWKDKVNIEDMLFAGAVTNRIKERFEVNCDSAFIAENLYSQHQNDLMPLVEKTSHYRRLERLGLLNDIQYCFTADIAPSLPILRGARLENDL